MSFNTGVQVFNCPEDFIIQLYKDKRSDLPSGLEPFPNQFIYLKSESVKAMAIFQKGELHVISDQNIDKISPRNKEQTMLIRMLQDDDIPLNVVTGTAGSGKTLLALASALNKIQNKKFDKIIITRPMVQVGNKDFGILPGDVNEKLNPYLGNFTNNLQQLVGKRSIPDALEMYKIETLPLQLIRGCSWTNTMILVDEIQNLTHHEMLTLGTRVGEGSKLVLLGDLDQIDERIKPQDTGLWHLVNHPLMKESPLMANIHLLKCERSPLTDLFTKTFKKGNLYGDLNT